MWGDVAERQSDYSLLDEATTARREEYRLPFRAASKIDFSIVRSHFLLVVIGLVMTIPGIDTSIIISIRPGKNMLV